MRIDRNVFELERAYCIGIAYLVTKTAFCFGDVTRDYHNALILYNRERRRVANVVLVSS